MDKGIDLLGQSYLQLKVSKVKYAPIRDNDIVRACAFADLPTRPGPQFGGLSALDAGPALLDYMGWVLNYTPTMKGL